MTATRRMQPSTIPTTWRQRERVRESEREGERGREKRNVNAIHGAIRIASALYAILARNL